MDTAFKFHPSYIPPKKIAPKIGLCFWVIFQIHQDPSFCVTIAAVIAPLGHPNQ